MISGKLLILSISISAGIGALIGIKIADAIRRSPYFIRREIERRDRLEEESIEEAYRFEYERDEQHLRDREKSWLTTRCDECDRKPNLQ